MPAYNRPHTNTMLKRLDSEQCQRNNWNILFLYGARQSGKTTMVLEIHDRLQQQNRISQYITADDTSDDPLATQTSNSPSPSDIHWIKSHWRSMRSLLAETSQSAVLFIDEIQKIKNFPQTVKALWDEDRRFHTPLQVVLLSSSPLLMQDGLSESLAGRFEIFPLPHWSYTEMRDAFGYTLDEFIFYGGYPHPQVHVRDENHNQWRSYIKNAIITPALEHDIQKLTEIKDPATFLKFFEILAAESSQIFTFESIIHRLQSSDKATLKRYLLLYEKTQLLTALKCCSSSFSTGHANPLRPSLRCLIQHL